MRDDRLRLLDILAASESILQFVSGKERCDLERDLMFQSAVLHQLSIIGEAARSLSDATVAKHPEVPWRAIADFRNQVVHAYFSLDLEIVWETVASDLPRLESQIRDILARDFPDSLQKGI